MRTLLSKIAFTAAVALASITSIATVASTPVALAGGHGGGASGCTPPQVAAANALMQRYFDVFNAGDLSQANTVLTDDYWTQNPLGVFQGLSTYQAVMGGIYTAFPDIHYSIESVIVNGDQIVLEYSFTATHLGDFLGIPATGKVVHGRGMERHLVRNGKLAKTWNYSDIFGLVAQLEAP